MKYEKLSQQEHVLKRPDMYIGNIHQSDVNTYVCELDNLILMKKDIKITEGLVRIFIEPLSNAIDNVVRSREMNITPKYIKVYVDNNKITIVNDGYTIPVKYHETETDTYIPEMLFGQLLTSSNYDDTEKRYTSGKNGVGVSITNIFSTFFQIECTDTVTDKKYIQTWTDNMTKVSSPKITSYKNKKSGYTSVTWIADFKRFGVEEYSQDIIQLFKRYVVDTCMITKLDVYFNDEKLNIKSLLDYSKLFENVNINELYYIKDVNYEIVVGSSITDDYEQVSFVNGINTLHGGVHVDSCINAILKPILDKLTKNKKDITLKEFKTLFTFWINVTVPNPEFSSQNKTKLTAPNIKINPINSNLVSKILKWDTIDNGITQFMNVKDVTTLKKTEKKTKSFKAIKGYDPANLIKKYPKECTLILCEGLSAKTYAVTGISVGINNKKGRDYWGIYALRGKLLNTRNASLSQITKNKEIVDVIQILNLKFDTDYSVDKNFDTLNYGKVMIMTDQDTDGFHISGLIMNFFHSLFPSLFYRKDFLSSMFTPIMNVYKGKDVLRFYNLHVATEYLKSLPQNVQVKYLKGLGSSNDQDIKESFGKVLVSYQLSSQDKISNEMDKVFNNKFAEQRKSWLDSFHPDNTIMQIKSFVTEPQKYNVFFEDFLNIEMIKYSMDDCIRNLPNLYDGLKQSQRKILHSFILKGTQTKMKVSQWAGFVSEKTCYHHGEQCLFDTIIKMAQDFSGSNNIPLLEKDGQFGTRLYGGKDAASSRYIFAKLSLLVKYIFRAEDECILKYQYDDGSMIEPVNYIPIIPMLLVNGSVAIATGWSTNVPSFNPIDLIKYIKNILTKKSQTIQLLPWYNHYKSTFTKNGNKYITNGIIKNKNKTWVITELPIGVWIDNYKLILEEMLEQKKIKTLKNYSTADNVHFEIQMIEKYEHLSLEDAIEFFGLSSTINISNMVVLTDNNIHIKKFDTPEIIIEEFIPYRLEMYKLRKDTQLRDLRLIISKFENKIRFIKYILDGKLILSNSSKQNIIDKLVEFDFQKFDDNYNFLLNIPVYEFTTDYIDDLQSKIDNNKSKYEILLSTSEVDIWLNELTELENILVKYYE